MILGVDELMDMARTMVNLVGNCLATAVMARWEGELGPEPGPRDAGRDAGADRAGAHRHLTARTVIGPAYLLHRRGHVDRQTSRDAASSSCSPRPRSRPSAPRPRPRPPPRVSAPLANIRYDITFDSATAARPHHQGRDELRRRPGPGPVLLSLPAWTPGAYELTFFARWVSDFTPDGGREAAGLGQAGLRHLAGEARRRQVGDGHASTTWPTRSTTRWRGPSRTSRFFNGTNVLPLPRRPRHRFPGHRHDQDRAVLAGRDRHAAGCRSSRGRTARRTITTWWTSRSSWAGWISTARRWPDAGPAWPPIPPAR